MATLPGGFGGKRRRTGAMLAVQVNTGEEESPSLWIAETHTSARPYSGNLNFGVRRISIFGSSELPEPSDAYSPALLLGSYQDSAFSVCCRLTTTGEGRQ